MNTTLSRSGLGAPAAAFGARSSGRPLRLQAQAHTSSAVAGPLPARWAASGHRPSSAASRPAGGPAQQRRPRCLPRLHAQVRSAAVPQGKDAVRDYDGKYAHGSRSLVPEDVLANLDTEERGNVLLFQSAAPSVVNIATSTAVSLPFIPPGLSVPSGMGSGFIWDREGHVVTNAHVVQRASEVRCTLYDGTEATAKVVGRDRARDIAVLQLQVARSVASRQLPVTLGSSTNLLVGQKVFAIGNPFGLDHTLTQGIVSGLGRELAGPGARPGDIPMSDIIQTDAAVNPGNSGGVLLDSRGRLVGIPTAIVDPSGRGAYSGVGLAIPIDSAKGLIDQILKYGRVRRPYLGVALAPRELSASMEPDGVLVLEVAPRSPASKANIKPTTRWPLSWGDKITKVNGVRVESDKDLYAALDECLPGQTVDMKVQQARMRGKGWYAQRAGQEPPPPAAGDQQPLQPPRTVRVTLGERPQSREDAGAD